MTRVLGRDELHAAVRPMVDAFWDYPETVHLLPDDAARRHVLPRKLLSDVRDAARFRLALGAHVPNGNDGDDGEILGAAAWIPPEAYPISIGRQLRQVLDLAPAAPWAWRSLREAQRGQADNRANHVVHPPHYYLRALGVAPHCQGTGVGSSLVTPVLALADERGVGCFLQTATAANVSWYERFGFEVAATYRPTPSWPEVWTMWRSPQTTA